MLPHRDDIDWIFDTARWFLRHLGGGGERWRKGARLTLPTEDDFPVDRELDDYELAEDYLAFVQHHANLSRWTLHVIDPLEVEADRHLAIPVDRLSIQDSMGLVARLARGAAHYVAQVPPEQPPDGAFPEAVDVTAVFLSFGVFIASCSFPRVLPQRELGKVRTYAACTALPSEAACYAAALNAVLIGRADDADTYLSADARRAFREARTDLSRRTSRLDELARTCAASRGPGPYRA